jgi:hypothetical protein
MSRIRRLLRVGVPALLAILALAFSGQAQGVHIEGTVTNGTLNRPVPNAEVLLLTPRPQVGMQLITKVTADATGHFAISQSDLDPNTFYLVQVNAGDVPYHFPVRPGAASNATVDAIVYDTTKSDPGISVSLMRIMVQANGDKAQVQQEYTVKNDTRPPRTFDDAAGTFRFRLPSGVSQPAISVAGLMNMQIPQTPTPGKSPGELVLHYPVKPGETKVTVRYETDYASAGLEVSGSAPYPIDRAELYVMPANLEVKSALFKPAGRDESNNIESSAAENLPRNAALTATLSGEAELSQQAGDQQSESQVKVEPNPMTKLGVPLLIAILLILLWALGICAGKEWQRLKTRGGATPERRKFEAKAEELLNSLADLDELFEAEKIEKKQYWKERLELKAKLAAILKKGPTSLLESYATRRVSP